MHSSLPGAGRSSHPAPSDAAAPAASDAAGQGGAGAPTPAARAADRIGARPADTPGRHALGEAPPRPPAAGQHPAVADPADLQLAAYLLARDRTGRPVQPAAKELLLRANETKKEVLATMRFGRGNVESDLALTGHVGFHRMLAVRSAIKSHSTLGEDAQVTATRDAALSAYAGSGNCWEHANVAALIHAGRLQEGERVETRSSTSFDHTWVEVYGRAPPSGPPACAVIDAWGEGPVVEPIDNRFATPRVPSPRPGGEVEESEAHEALAHMLAEEPLGCIGSGEAADLHRQFEQIRADPGASMVRRIGLLAAANARDEKRPPADDVYTEPVPFVKSALCQAAREAIDGRQDDPPLRRQAALIAREVVPALPPAHEDAAVDAILAYAADLQACAPRSLVAADGDSKRSRSESDPSPDDESSRRRRL